MRATAVLLAGGLAVASLGSCSHVVRYTNDLTAADGGRTWFTRYPAAAFGTVGFVVGIPVDILVSPVSWVVYRSQPRETRDVLSVFLFPSFALWKACALLAAPFDLVEWGTWRWWHDPPPLSPEQREAIERAWDLREYSEYPVTPIYPPGRSG